MRRFGAISYRSCRVAHPVVFGAACRAALFAALLPAILCPRAAARAQSAPAARATPGAFVQVDGSQLYYEECGTAPLTVVLIHDGVVDSAVWDDVWPDFCRHFHAVRYDRRGYGRSPAATTWYSEVDDLAALLRHLEVPHAVLVGSSHGGELSINFTLAHPEIVQQLVLVGAVVGGMPYSQHFLDRGRHAFALLNKGDVKAAIAEWSKDRYLIAADHEAARKRLFDLLSANPQDMTHPDFPLRDHPALPRLHEIRVPTLLVTGDADIPDVHAHAGAIEAGVPGARRIVIEDVGHIMVLEKPAEFSRVVIGFIELNRH
jgi:3-oxoadipate enol-lactonase